MSTIATEVATTVKGLGATRLLLIEDNPADAEMTRIHLDGASLGALQTELAVVLDDAERALFEREFDCVLLDLSLPDAEGLDGVQTIRRIAPHLPIVVLSGSEDDHLQIGALQAGAEDYLIKGRTDAEAMGRAIRYAVERKRVELELARREREDPLTGLANQKQFFDWLSEWLGSPPDGGFALMVGDIEGLRAINEDVGHRGGDALLVELARRFERCVRRTDRVARLGGGEFALLLADVTDTGALVARIESLLSEAELAVTTAGGVVTPAVNAGITRADPANDLVEAVLARAKEAGQRAKLRARRWEMAETVRARAIPKVAGGGAAEEPFPGAEVVAHYQPVVTLPSGAVVGVEALARLSHPEAGLLLPGDFLPAYEERDAVGLVTTAVLRQAAADVARWRSHEGPLRDLWMSLNVSARELAAPGWLDLLLDITQHAGLPTSAVVIDVKEAAVSAEGDGVRRILELARRAGFRVAIDDFGTAFAALGTMRKFPVDIVKIDRSFTAGLGTSQTDTVIVGSIITLMSALGVSTIASGVEAREQRTMLVDLGARFAQGYYFARPMAGEDLWNFVSSMVGR